MSHLDTLDDATLRAIAESLGVQSSGPATDVRRRIEGARVSSRAVAGHEAGRPPIPSPEDGDEEDFDISEAGQELRAPSLAQCPSGHLLIPVNGKPTNYPDWFCDGCRNRIPHSTQGVLHCEPCKYDICPDCRSSQRRTLLDVRDPEFEHRLHDTLASLAALLSALSTPQDQGLRDEDIQARTAEGIASGAEAPCAVCLEPMAAGRDRCRTLPCFHRYHTACIDPWLRGTPTCPVCKTAVGA